MRIAGVDEAGRGPLAGPVLAAAVILNPNKDIIGLNDSKKLSLKKRMLLEPQIKEFAIAWAIGRSEWFEIDQINILQASLLAMKRAVESLIAHPELVLVDGNHCPALDVPVKAIIGGDSLEPAISAASILAKQERDREMEAMEEIYPGYGFAKHKGYPTAEHMSALNSLGPSPIHRRSFKPVQKVL